MEKQVMILNQIKKELFWKQNITLLQIWLHKASSDNVHPKSIPAQLADLRTLRKLISFYNRHEFKIG
jgi:hypothetical protein